MPVKLPNQSINNPYLSNSLNFENNGSFTLMDNNSNMSNHSNHSNQSNHNNNNGHNTYIPAKTDRQSESTLINRSK
jgi:hypothetical protein